MRDFFKGTPEPIEKPFEFINLKNMIDIGILVIAVLWLVTILGVLLFILNMQKESSVSQTETSVNDDSVKEKLTDHAGIDLEEKNAEAVVETEEKEKSLEWYQKAAEQGDVLAQLFLGFCYEYGQGVEQSYEAAVEWYKKSSRTRRCRCTIISWLLL